LESLGFGVARKCEAWDFFGRPLGVYPLVVPKQWQLHADIYAEEGNGTYSLYADPMDQLYLESLCVPQRYAQLMVERRIADHQLLVENIVFDRGSIYYQIAPISLAINVVISIDGEVRLDIYDAVGNEFSFLTALEEG